MNSLLSSQRELHTSCWGVCCRREKKVAKGHAKGRLTVFFPRESAQVRGRWGLWNVSHATEGGGGGKIKGSKAKGETGQSRGRGGGGGEQQEGSSAFSTQQKKKARLTQKNIVGGRPKKRKNIVLPTSLEKEERIAGSIKFRESFITVSSPIKLEEQGTSPKQEGVPKRKK